MTALDREKSLSDADFAKIRAIVYENTGITIGENRKGMVFSRLQKRLRVTGETTFARYIARVEADAAEMQELTNRITTNETYFYRTPRIWDHFRTEVIPAFRKSAGGRQMRVWSAASSTGEEAHTIGVLCEDLRLQHPGFEYSVLGTDISTHVLEIAQEGHYIGRPVARFQQVEPALFSRHMVGTDQTGYRVRPEISKRLNWRLHNLLKPLTSGGPFDAVFLRNVLIYFKREDQEKILKQVEAQMRPEAVLYIGESETLNNLTCGFEAEAPLIYRLSHSPRKERA